MTTSRKLGLLSGVLLGASVAAAPARETGASDGDILARDGRADCEHRVDLWDCYSDGWNDNTLDVLVNGATVLNQITLPSGTGPLSFYFMAGTGDVIQTVYYVYGGWPYEPYYFIYNGAGQLIGQDGVQGSDCYMQPTGITVYGGCDFPCKSLGACCYEDGTCTYECDAVTCEAKGGYWQGPGSQCGACPCFVPCPPGAIPEPEPCGESTDGGCGMEVPTFVPLSCGDTMCGTIWATTEEHDTDWYEIVTTDWNYFTWTVECEIPVLIVVIQAGPGGGCEGVTILGSATAGACEPATFTTDARPADKYWFWVGSADWSDWPCEQHYTATLTCEPTVPTYCPASGGCDEYIARVQIDTIDNSTMCSHYGDYTFEQTGWQAVLPYGEPVTLTVTNGNPIWSSDTCSVWIDWNHDLVFDDDTESLGDDPGVGPYVFAITAPGSAPLGPTRMRIRIDYANANPQPCGTTSYGEVEDYTVNIMEVAGACCWGDGTCTQELPSACGDAWAGPFTHCAGADCNSNAVDDFCDIASGYSTDCQPNGIPDECDLVGAYIYQHDDGTAENTVGLTGDGYIAWLNHFVVGANHGRIQNIQIVFGIVPDYTPVTVYLWSDPNQDGDPHDAQVLAQVSGLTMNWGSNVFEVFDIPDTDVGPPGTHFFVGAIIHNLAGEYPASIDETSWAHQSWVAADADPIDPNNLGAAGMPLSLIDNYGFPGNWMIRAGADDGRDCNNNGVPDECDPLCVGDLNCDGSIDFGDINPFVLYLSNLAAWQAAYPACNCLNGDIDYDGTYGQGSFGDINPFVALIVESPSGCPY